MKLRFLFLCLIIANFGCANLTKHLKTGIGKEAKNKAIEHIDAIYLINLDQRPEKLEKTMRQLDPYGIIPYRFSAIYGWGLSNEALNEVGMKYQKNMVKGKWVFHYPAETDAPPQFELLSEEFCGKTCVERNTTPGAIGCALSHLSILQNAYDQGYETIWVLEDDISVQDDPHKLGAYIAKLDALIGRNGWDILYTDMDTLDNLIYQQDNDFISELKGAGYYWRPDLELSDQKRFTKRTVINEDFLRIGCRMRAHSIIYRRSGIKKILDFEKKHSLFLPYDNELPLIPDIKMVNLRHDVVTVFLDSSDTRNNSFTKGPVWESHKKDALSEISNILGWRNPILAEKIMDFIHKKKPEVCVEIGAFGGAITFPIAKALEFQKRGVVYAIDAWDFDLAVKGLSSKKDIDWWRSVNFPAVRASFENLFSKAQVQLHCQTISKCSAEAASAFEKETIDLLFIDGNSSSEGSLEDVSLYLPKVKRGGYVWIKNAYLPEKHKAVLHLMEKCKWIKDESLGEDCAVFQKT